MADDNSHGYTSDDTGVWPDTTQTGNQNSTGDPSKDFDGLSWKQIEAAVLGGGSMEPGQDSLDKAYGNVNWQSLQSAAGVFQEVEQNLTMIAQSIKDQTAALAGDDGPWKGTSAGNFKTMMTTFANKFSDLADRIGDGGGANNVPNNLVNAAAYLQWAQDTIRYIDRYYAAQVIARGKQLDDGRAYISQYPDAVEMMTNDMRKVAGQLSQKYNTVHVNEGKTTPPPTPGPGDGGTGGGDGPDLPDPPPVTDPPPPPPPVTPPPTPPPVTPPPVTTPPPGGNNGPGGDGTPPPVNNAEIPPPPGDQGGTGNGTPPPVNNAEIPPPPGDQGGTGNGTPPPVNNAEIPPPPGDQGGTGNGTPPPVNNAEIPPPPGDQGGTGNGTPPPVNNAEIPPPPGDQGGTGNGTPPPISPPPIAPPPGSTGGGPNGIGNNNIKTPPPGDATGGNNLTSPKLPSPPGGTGNNLGGNNLGGNNAGNLQSPQIPSPPGGSGPGGGLTNNALNPAQLPPGLQQPPADQGPGASAPPMMPPGGMGGAGGMNQPGAERPDSSGLLGNVKEPWLDKIPNGIGDPNSHGETPPGAGNNPGGSSLKSPQIPSPPGGADGLGDGSGNDLGGPGPIKGLGESDLPKLPDPIGGNQNGQQQQQQGPGAGSPPMMPPGGMGGAGGMNQPGAERPDSSGLLGNVKEPWLDKIPNGIGDPNSHGETPPLDSAEWAPPPGDVGGAGGSDSLGDGPGGVGGSESPGDGFKGLGGSDLPKLPDPIGGNQNGEQQQQQGPGQGAPPMVPPGGMGGAGGMNQPGAERPDSAGLLGNVNEPWEVQAPDGIGDPSSHGATPPLQSAGWAPPPGDIGGTKSPGDGPGGVGGSESPGDGFKGLGGSDLPKLPDPIGGNQNGQQQQQQGPGQTAPPMVPPGGMGGAGGMNQPGAERPDSAGLLGNVNEPWAVQAPDGVGDPSAFGETPRSESAAWAAPADNQADTPVELPGAIGNGPQDQQTPGQGAPPMVPPGGMGGAGGMNQPGAERPDSAGLLGNVNEPWAVQAPDGVGDPSAFEETPRSAAASWAMPPAEDAPVEQGVLPSVPVGTSPVDGEPTRPGAGPLTADPQAWVGEPGEPVADQVPANTGWGTAGQTQREEHAAPPVTPHGGDADDIVRIAVVQPIDAEDTSAWDVGTAEFLPGLLPIGTPAQGADRTEEISTDYVERSAEPWRAEQPEPAGPEEAQVMATYHRLRAGQGPLISDDLPMCGDGPEPDPGPSEADSSAAGDEDGEEAEEEERTMADLLRQDDSAWRSSVNRSSSGVLE
ncbi:hypothetical protein GCM10022222_47720 [Amycolatopsis ultiminotia]|uniref:Uncharacterized protein n=1 Tax=Amycolatopsis ultiminotia TaxID=543629 RepID=A0ABP6WYN3_9PSEU